MAKTKVVYAGGFWATNMGNAFYNLGVVYLLKQLHPDFEVCFLGDQPGWFWSEKGHNPSNSLDYLGHVKMDYLVISGPLMNLNCAGIWENTLKSISKKTKIVLLSAGGVNYTKEEIEACKKLFKKYRLHILVTRDSETYENYSQLADFSYNGICNAFFASDYFQPIETDFDPYIVYNFEHMPEPKIRMVSSKINEYAFDWAGEKWLIDKNESLFARLFGGFKDESLQDSGKYKIIRTKHFCLSNETEKLFNKPNMIISDVPYTYLNVYANTACTFSDRVHTCVGTLAFGKPAMLFSKSKRSFLFDRLGLGDIRKHPVVLDKNVVDCEKIKMIQFLRKHMVE